LMVVVVGVCAQSHRLLMSKIYKRYSTASSATPPPPPPLGGTHKDEEEKQANSISHSVVAGDGEGVILPKHKSRNTPMLLGSEAHQPTKRRKHTHHHHAEEPIGTRSQQYLQDMVVMEGDELVEDDEEEEEEEEEEEDDEEEEMEYKQKKRKVGGGAGRKSKNIPQCTRCNERAAWKHDKKGKRWFCKHCKLPFTPGVVPFNYKPKKENGDVLACVRCGKTVRWPHDKTSKRKYICMKCKRPFRPDEAESDEDYLGYTSSDSRDRETIELRGMDRRYHDYTPVPDIDGDERESFQDYGASKILMALKSDRLFCEVLSSSD